MITYHYNLWEDFKAQALAMRELAWLKEHRIKVFYFNPWETIKLIVKQPKIYVDCREDVKCYWVSGGTWGSYYPPDKIKICPRQASIPFLEDAIRHEITHIKQEPFVQGMTHEEKETYIQSK